MVKVRSDDNLCQAIDILRGMQQNTNIIAEDINYYSFPKAFGSTCGPFPGIGGQVITNFQIDVYDAGFAAVVFANGRFWKTIEGFMFQTNI